jgi:hypothetical protein
MGAWCSLGWRGHRRGCGLRALCPRQGGRCPPHSHWGSSCWCWPPTSGKQRPRSLGSSCCVLLRAEFGPGAWLTYWLLSDKCPFQERENLRSKDRVASAVLKTRLIWEELVSNGLRLLDWTLSVSASYPNLPMCPEKAAGFQG